jgi:DNA-binding CsgD family transcriptional regulator
MHGHNDLVRASTAGGQPFYRYMAACCAYGRTFARGDLAAAARTTAALDEIGGEFGSDATDGSYGVQMFMLQRATDRLEQVRPLVDGTERTDDHWAPGLLALYTALDLGEAAARVLTDLLQRVDTYRTSAHWASVLAFMTEAAVHLRDVDAAERLRPLAAPHSGHNLVAGQFVAVFGSADRYIAQLDSLLGTDTADDHFEQALAMDRRMGATLHQVDTLSAWRRHVERRGGTAGARRAANLRAEAQVLAERIGHRRALRDLGVATGQPAQSVPPDGLTEREVDVLRLVADGLSNREIGDRLFISQNTAANHIRSILMKIGAPNRTRAAIYAVDHGLLDDRVARDPRVHPTARPSQR